MDSINQDSQELTDTFTREEMEQHLTRSLQVVSRIEAGEISRQQGLEELIRQGATKQFAGNFLLHTLDQAKLDKLAAETGLIID